MRDSDYTEGQRQSVEGRWTVRWLPFTASGPGGYKVGGSEPWPDETPTPVVPCDDATIERVWPQIAERHEFSGDYAYEVVCDVLRLAGEGGSADA